MSQPKPHLLTLPRELRNRIYDFLTHEIDLRNISSLGNIAVVIALTNAPYLSVLQTHSRICEEYFEAPCFTNPSASITDVEIWKDEIIWTANAHLHLDNTALALVKTVTMRLRGNKPSPVAIVEDLTARGLNLHTIRILQRQTAAEYTEATLPNNPPIVSLSCCIAHLPGSLIGLPMLQHDTGVRLLTAQRDGEMRYVLHEVQVYVYMSPEWRGGVQLWRNEKGVAHFHLSRWASVQMPRSWKVRDDRMLYWEEGGGKVEVAVRGGIERGYECGG